MIDTPSAPTAAKLAFSLLAHHRNKDTAGIAEVTSHIDSPATAAGVIHMLVAHTLWLMDQIPNEEVDAMLRQAILVSTIAESENQQ